MVKALFEELVSLSDERFCPEISHAEALFGRAADPDVPFSILALRRLGRTRPALFVAPGEGEVPSGMRTTFGPGSSVRLEVFHAAASVHGRRPASASIRTGRAPRPGASAARLDGARSDLTEHAVSYLVRNDRLALPVPQRGDPTAGWEEQLLRTTHWVSDMRRRRDRIFVDDGTVPVLRVDDPLGAWAAVAFDLGADRVTIAGAAGFLDRRFTTRPAS
ncbi:hypothetical protein B7R22_14570 [Subtercola boreus]|uniref:Uncharacterized protein n=1 Tax=Subtercola boreus TaxID=120213 RepID=A0A3E0VTN9_9MICO|nr:hypothetical protein [Subtercola boreus]RFA12869.1 hypothetical protein B7R22_14570 [Subtercola boreus]